MVDTRSMVKKKRKLIRLMDNFSEDIIMEIMLRLPVKSAVRFRCVCKPWYKLLTSSSIRVKLNYDSLFINTNQGDYVNKHVYFIDNRSLSSTSLIRPVKIKHPLNRDVYVFGTCNGLVCASFGFGLYIWNPCTREYRVILTIQGSCDFNWQLNRTGYGFCYDSKTRDYKVIVFYNGEFNSRDSKVRVYTLVSNSWRTLPGRIPYFVPMDGEKYSGRGGFSGVFLNGALHWLVDSAEKKENPSKVLLSFNIADERFHEISQPDEKWEKFDYKFVGVLGERLCMLCSVSKVGFEVWVMNDDGVKASWDKLFQIDQVPRPFNYLRNIVYLRNGDILLDDEKSSSFILYDPKQKTVRYQPVLLPEESGFRERNRRNIYVYTESLVSVNSGTHVGDKQERLDYLKAVKGIR